MDRCLNVEKDENVEDFFHASKFLLFVQIFRVKNSTFQHALCEEQRIYFEFFD